MFGVDGDLLLGEFGGCEFLIYVYVDYLYWLSFNILLINSVWVQILVFGFVNVWFGLCIVDGLIDVLIWVKNLFDKDYYFSFLFVNIGVVIGQVGELWIYGVIFCIKL